MDDREAGGLADPGLDVPMTTPVRLAGRGAGRVAVGAVAAVVLLSVSIPAGATAAGLSTVGVVDFYGQTVLPGFSGVFPERFAADDLAASLARAAAGRFTVVPRAAIEKAEAAANWRGEDVLRFARLTMLARTVGADRLVTGWLRLDLSGDAGGGGLAETEGPGMVRAAIVVQVFDAAQGRLIAETQQTGFAVGIEWSVVVVQAIHRALGAALPSLLGMLVPAS